MEKAINYVQIITSRPWIYWVCKAKSTENQCASLMLLTRGVKYSQICGTVIGYQDGGTVAFNSGADIDSPYLTGVSITRSTGT